MENTKIRIETRADSVARLEEQLKLNRELLFFNGSQWYIKADEDCVIIFDTGSTFRSYTSGIRGIRYFFAGRSPNPLPASIFLRKYQRLQIRHRYIVGLVA